MQRLRRRRVLAGTTTGLALALAGCGSPGGGGEGGGEDDDGGGYDRADGA